MDCSILILRLRMYLGMNQIPIEDGRIFQKFKMAAMENVSSMTTLPFYREQYGLQHLQIDVEDVSWHEPVPYRRWMHFSKFKMAAMENVLLLYCRKYGRHHPYIDVEDVSWHEPDPY